MYTVLVLPNMYITVDLTVPYYIFPPRTYRNGVRRASCFSQGRDSQLWGAVHALELPRGPAEASLPRRPHSSLVFLLWPVLVLSLIFSWEDSLEKEPPSQRLLLESLTLRASLYPGWDCAPSRASVSPKPHPWTGCYFPNTRNRWVFPFAVVNPSSLQTGRHPARGLCPIHP